MSNNFLITKFRALQNKEIYNWDYKNAVYVSEQTLDKESIEYFYPRGIQILAINVEGKIYNFQESKLFNEGQEVVFGNVINFKNKILVINSNNGSRIPLENLEILERVSDKNKLKILESRIKEKCPRTIRIQNFYKKEVKNLNVEQFLKEFLSNWNNKKATIFVDSKQEYTPPKKRRSLADLYVITKYYYPQITLKEFIDILYSKVLETNGYRTSYCGQTLKRMYYYSPTESNAILSDNYLDEFGFFIEDYIDIIDE